MKLFKIILIFFIIYFVRRFIQLYKVVQKLHANQLRENSQMQKQSGAVDAEYKVIKDTWPKSSRGLRICTIIFLIVQGHPEWLSPNFEKF